MALDCCNTSKDLAKINKSGCATVEKWIETLRKCEILEPPDLLTLCRMSKDVLVAENSLRYKGSPKNNDTLLSSIRLSSNSSLWYTKTSGIWTCSEIW